MEAHSVLVSRSIAGFALIALAACSGGGVRTMVPQGFTGSSSGAPVSSSTTRATFVIHWAAPTSQSGKRRNTISASTQSISVAVDGGVQTVVNKPALSGSPSSTSVSISAPVGNDSFTFIAWDETNATGNILDQATTSQAVVANANNTVVVSLDGVCAALVPTLYASSVYAETRSITTPVNAGSRTILKSARLVGNFPQSFSFTPVDADGNTILTGAGTGAISVTESGATPHVTIAANAAGAANTIFKVTPIVAEPDGFSTQLAASSPNCGPGTTTLPNSFALSTSAEVFVADFIAGVLAFDQDGTQLATISTTPSILGLAYNSKSNYLVTLEHSTSSMGLVAFHTLSTTGSLLGSGYFTPTGFMAGGVNSPENLAYNPVNGFFVVAMSEGDVSGTTTNGTLQNVAISGSTATLEPSNFSAAGNPTNPTALVTLPNGNIIVNDFVSSGSTYLFDRTGNLLDEMSLQATAFALDPVRGLVFADIGNNVQEPVGAIISYGPNSFTTPLGEFELPDNSNGYSAVAYNQGEDEFYLLGYGSSGFAGSSGDLPNNQFSNESSSAFSSLVDPIQAAVIP